MKKSSSISFKTLKVSIGLYTHEVYIGHDALAHIGRWLLQQPSKRAFIIADQKLIHARKLLIRALKRSHWEVHEMPVHAGEELKNFNTIYPLYGDLLREKANRDSVLFALGGGTIGDACGFIASTYLRGIRWIGVPTTLLAQVDSSLGGKTGINHSEGKNLIGTFYQPSLVICDTRFLKTLGRREMLSGFGEMIKYGVIFDPNFFKFLEKNQSHILSLKPSVLVQAIHKCLYWKARAISKDEFDRTGIREVLNFGHTFGHALESITQYTRFQHGEAVIWGMRFALALSVVRKKLSIKRQLEIDSILSRLPVPPLPLDSSLIELFKFMKMDKKVRHGKIHYVLLKDVGRTITDSDVTYDDLVDSYQLLTKRVTL